MVETYNFYNLEALFKEYLLAGNKKPISVKNYLSDFRHFTGWITFYLQSNQLANDKEFISFLTEKNIQEYKNYLAENKIPNKTINRRLSTVRTFCSFCISQGWIKENPGKKIINMQDDVLLRFQKDTNAVISSLNDIQEFMSV